MEIDWPRPGRLNRVDCGSFDDMQVLIFNEFCQKNISEPTQDRDIAAMMPNRISYALYQIVLFH